MRVGTSSPAGGISAGEGREDRSMTQMISQDDAPGPRAPSRRFLARFGPVAVTISAVVGLVTLLVFAGYTPIVPTDDVVLSLFLADVGVIFLLFGLLIAEGWTLYAAWRHGEAGARLHAR